MKRARKGTAKGKRKRWELRLYVADISPRSMLALSNLIRLCDQYLGEEYGLRVIDVIEDPGIAVRDNILATPTLVRVKPDPQKTLIGCLSDVQAVCTALDIGPGTEADFVPLRSENFVHNVGSA
jgi:circadian clock protein KaiB